MSNYRARAQRFRWWLLAIAVTCLLVGLWWIYGPRAPEEAENWAIAYLILTPSIEEGTPQWKFELLVIGVLLLLQFMFLCPGRQWRIRLSEKARPMRMAVIGAACMAMLLSIGLAASLSEIFCSQTWSSLTRFGDEKAPPWQLYGAMAGLWLFWAGMFWHYRRSADGLSRLSGLATGLVAGSLLELLVAVGVYAWNPREEDCWCVRGSYTGLVLGGTVLIWAFGPALLPLFLRQNRLRRRTQRPQ